MKQNVHSFFSLFDDLGGGAGAIGVGGHLDGQAVGLCHLLTCQVEVTHTGNLLACIEFVNTGIGINLKVNDVTCIPHAIHGVVGLETDAMIKERSLVVIEVAAILRDVPAEAKD